MASNRLGCGSADLEIMGGAHRRRAGCELLIPEPLLLEDKPGWPALPLRRRQLWVDLLPLDAMVGFAPTAARGSGTVFNVGPEVPATLRAGPSLRLA